MLRPYGNLILVKQDHDELITKGGIVIPETAKEKATRGIVMGVGTQYVGDVKVGDKVLFANYAGAEIIQDNIEYLVVKDMDILCVLV